MTKHNTDPYAEVVGNAYGTTYKPKPKPAGKKTVPHRREFEPPHTPQAFYPPQEGEEIQHEYEEHIENHTIDLEPSRN